MSEGAEGHQSSSGNEGVSGKDTGDKLLEIYDVLNGYFGNMNWWPGESPFEVAVGAILTQNTNWNNVERAIASLKSEHLLDSNRLFEAEETCIAALIRPAGYYNIKARRLKAFLGFLHEEYEGDMGQMFQDELWHVRERLLSVKGIGEETADSILLYGGNKAIFVVDAYTRRILERHGIIKEGCRYGEIQKLFMESLTQDSRLYNQYHALLVQTAKSFCKKRPHCDECPLNNMINI